MSAAPAAARVTLYQGRPCAHIPEVYRQRLRATRPDVLCLPEYFWVPPAARAQKDAAGFAAEAHRRCARLSRELDCVVVGGSMVVEEDGRLFNECPVYDRGRLAGTQRKLAPTDRERACGVTPGDGYRAIAAGGRSLGVLICADVLVESSFATMRRLGVDLIVAPTLSPWRRHDPPQSKAERDREIYQAGAKTAGAPVAKVCGVGHVFGHGRLQGRSLIATAAGVVARVAIENESRVQILTATV